MLGQAETEQAERTGRQLGHAVELGRAGDDVRAGPPGSRPKPGKGREKRAGPSLELG